MRTLQLRPSDRASAAPATRRPAPSVARHPVSIRRSCPCGGGCPRCTGAGQALSSDVRMAMQQRLGAPLADVRIHTDAAAARAAAAAGANAFTLGADIFFAEGRFAPHTTAGATRLAHELVHVVQQRRGTGGMPKVAGHRAEREARELGVAVAGGRQVAVRGAAPRAVQHDDAEGGAAPASPQLHLDPEIERMILFQHFMRWWLGSALVEGDAPTALPSPDAPATGDVLHPVLPPLPPLQPDLFAPLPPDPTFLEPDVGALYAPFGERGAPVGAGDSDAVMGIYRRNAAIAAGLPDLRAIAPRFVRPLIPSTWRRDIAGALTGAAVGNSLKGDFMTPIEVSDRAFQSMTGASTTVIPLPSISFDLF